MNEHVEMSLDKNTEFKSELDDKNNTIVSHKKGRAYFLLTDEEYKKVFKELSDKSPKLFIKDRVLIMKKGIHRDIFNGGELEFSKTIIRKFLKLYTGQVKYIKLHTENTARYDLDGNEAGFVTKEDVVGLAKKKEEIKKQFALKKIKKAAKKKFDDANKENKPKNNSEKSEAENTNSKKPKLGLNIEAGNKNG